MATVLLPYFQCAGPTAFCELKHCPSSQWADRNGERKLALACRIAQRRGFLQRQVGEYLLEHARVRDGGEGSETAAVSGRDFLFAINADSSHTNGRVLSSGFSRLRAQRVDPKPTCAHLDSLP